MNETQDVCRQEVTCIKTVVEKQKLRFDASNTTMVYSSDRQNGNATTYGECRKVLLNQKLALVLQECQVRVNADR